MKRKLLVLLASVIICCGIAIYIKGENRYSKDFYNPLLVQPLDAVVEKGIDCVYENKPDSALAYFSVVIGQYNESMPHADKVSCAKAYNSKGYVELFEQRQLGPALISLMTAEQIENEVGDSTLLPLIYLNMANIFAYTNQIDYVIRYNRRSAQLALKQKAWRTYLTAFRNLVFQAIMDRDVADIKADLDKFGSIKIPDANMKGFAQFLYSGGNALLEKRWDDAYDYFLKADSVNDAELTPDRSHFMSVLLRSRVLQLRGEPRFAIKEILDNYDDYKGEQISSVSLILSRLYDSIGEREQASKHKLMYYENSDTLGILASNRQLMAAESQFRLNNMSGEVTRLNARRKAWVTISFVCILSTMVLAVALVLVIRSRRRLRRSQDELFLKNESIVAKPLVSPDIDTEDYEEGQRIMEVLEHSAEIFEVGFSVEKAAMLTGVHSRRISKVLNSVFGKNFNLVVQELRIKEACRILATPEIAGSLNMAGIASRLGFKSRTYFSEVFKKHTGLTPTEYLRSAKRAGK